MNSASEQELYIQTVVKLLDICDSFFTQCQAQGTPRVELLDFILDFTGDDFVRNIALDHLNLLWPEGK